MERGLMWLPLLGIFLWLGWAGWNEYQKVEAYRLWAKSFQRAKYDVYAVLGQTGTDLTWGKPTRQGPINLQTFSLKNVRSLQLLVDGQPSDIDAPPENGKSASLEFLLADSALPVRIPFTEVALAAEWGKHLRQELLRYQLESSA